jgi:GMP synthase (glutamine-hydrolysing)
MHQKILIIDFGSQYTQLIARRIRELNVFSQIVPCNDVPDFGPEVKGIVLSGSPFSVGSGRLPNFEFEKIKNRTPILGICYGAQFLADHFGGKVSSADKREYGRAKLGYIEDGTPLFEGFPAGSQVWMSHGDTITELPAKFHPVASTSDVALAAFGSEPNGQPPVYGIQFHPEVTHSEHGARLLGNFVLNICGCAGDWTPAVFVEESVQSLKEKIGDGTVILGLSGGVDSSVAALLLHKAIGDRLHGIFVNNGLLRKNEYDEVLEAYSGMGLQVRGVDASARFLTALEGVSDPETKRKIIGRVFVEVFQEIAVTEKDAQWLGQGTIYPDVIESISIHGPAMTIKSHHNVGGLPEKLHLKVVEPLRELFKDEVRKVGRELGLDPRILNRHPFPGPGLAIRIIGAVYADRVQLLQEADRIFIDKLKEHGWYDQIWQAGAILTPIQSVGVMGDERTYENVVALRAVSSTDGMTADWSRLPHDVLADISTSIINQVKGINRVVYDISTKPPATIEWE